MRRLRDIDGSVIVFALVALVVVGVIAGYTLTRTTDNERRTGNERVYSSADAAVEAGLASAIARVQRVGSSNGATFESNDSVLDIDDWQPVDGVTDADGMSGGSDAADIDTNGRYQMQVRAGVEGCSRKRQRLITVTGTYQGTERRRFLCVTVIPRILRYALYTGGVPDVGDSDSGDSTALKVTGRGNLLLPPYYKAQSGVRGGDIGSNGTVEFDENATVNDRAADNALYDQLFPSEASSFSLGALFRGAGSAGVSDAPIVQSVPAGSHALAPITSFPDSTGKLNLNGDVITLATRTRFPDVSQLIPIWRASAVDNPNNDAVFDALPEHDDTGSLISRDDFASLVSGGANVNLYGVTYVDCRNEPGDITIDADVTVHQGSLIVDGCNLVIAPSGDLNIDRDLSRANAPVAHSNKASARASCKTNKGKLVGEHDELSGENNSDMYTDCLWNYPALAVLQHNDSNGGRDAAYAKRSGSLISHAQGSHDVTVDGVTWVARNLTIDPATVSPGHANFTSNGAVVVGGKATIGGNAGAAQVALKWHPLAQRMFYDADDARMGTYSVRTNDQPMATERPTVVMQDTPPNPSYDRHTKITWKINGDYDNVRCRVLYSDDPTPQYVPCQSTSFEGDLRGYLLDGVTFQVQACVLGVDERGTQTQLCNRWYDVGDIVGGVDKYAEEGSASTGKLVRDVDGPGDDSSVTWDISGAAAKVTFTATPPDPGPERSFMFQWKVTEENDDGSQNDVTASRVQECQLDGIPRACGNGSLAISPITVGQHTFRARAINSFTTGPWASYTWTRTAPALPNVEFTQTPDNPNPYAQPNDFAWVFSGGDNQYDTVTCTLDGATVTPCTNARTFTGLASGPHTFQVGVCNDGGCDPTPALYTWRVALAPPTITGYAAINATLTGHNNPAWDLPPSTTYAREWLLCDADGDNCTPIAGATSDSYVVKAGDLGHRIRYAVTVTTPGFTERAVSAPTDVVVESLDQYVTLPASLYQNEWEGPYQDSWGGVGNPGFIITNSNYWLYMRWHPDTSSLPPGFKVKQIRAVNNSGFSGSYGGVQMSLYNGATQLWTAYTPAGAGQDCTYGCVFHNFISYPNDSGYQPVPHQSAFDASQNIFFEAAGWTVPWGTIVQGVYTTAPQFYALIGP